MAVDYNLLNYLPAWCYAYGVRHIVFCSGSRSAPLTFSFSRFNKFTCHSIIDERSAGFVALGLSQSSQSPVVIIVTSGTAVVNLYPAIAEAFYSHTPLIIITADRPLHQLNIYEGQTIVQSHVFEPHVIGFYQAPSNINSDNFSSFESNLIDLFNTTKNIKKGPIHINIPFEEPFYPNHDPFHYPQVYDVHLIENNPEFADKFEQNLFDKNILYIAARDNKDDEFEELMKSLSIPILADITSNLYSTNNIYSFEAIIRKYGNVITKPDLIISSGRGLVSKILKNYISTLKDIPHIYISSNGEIAECTSTANYFYKGSKISFFKKYLSGFISNPTYLNEWKQFEEKACSAINSLVSRSGFSEFETMRFVFNSIPESYIVHLANSMPVRWGQIFFKGNQKVFCNRGTSGIDGSTSTAIGFAIDQPKEQHLLITGDISFFYDINAFWQNHFPNNLKVIVLNNHGGGIFRLIEGPSNQPEVEPLFAMPRQRSIQISAHSFGIKYFYVNHISDLEIRFNEFIAYAEIAILEIDTQVEINGDVFELYRQIKY
jgi:2-succinyl-5-enolpyruvyl-6-hydroxy-3-cyclohexene-1-carboxylate synthase